MINKMKFVLWKLPDYKIQSDMRKMGGRKAKIHFDISFLNKNIKFTAVYKCKT